MATSKDVDDSVIRADGHWSPNCSNCLETGATKTAQCFCNECDLALCGACETMHRKFAQSHGMEYYDKNRSQVDKEQLVLRCSVHRRQETDLFCEDHDLLICSKCKDGDHSGCSMYTTADAGDKYDVPKEICEILDELMKTNDDAQKLRRLKQLQLTELNAQIDDCSQAITSLRRKFSILFDRYETQLMSKGSNILGSLTSSLRSIGSLSERLNTHVKLLEDERENMNAETAFKHMVIAKCKYKKFNDELAEIYAKKTSYDISLEEDKSLPSLMDKLSELVRQEVNTSDEVLIDTTNQPLKRSFLKIKSCTPVKETDPQVRSDEGVPNIYGCCWLPDDNGLIVCDNDSKNKTLKLFDKEMNIKFTAKCSSDPYDVCCIDKTTAVVTLPSAKEIQFFTVHPGFKFQEKKNVKLACHGVISNGKNIFLCIYESSSVLGVKVLTLDGTDVRFIPHIGPGYPMKVCLDPSDNILYTGGYRTNVFVNRITNDGHGVFSVSSKNLYEPRGIVCDTEGNVLVCDADKTVLQVISSTGVFGEIVMTDKEYKPKAMCVNKTYDILAIAYRKSASPFNSKIVLLKLEYA